VCCLPAQCVEIWSKSWIMVGADHGECLGGLLIQRGLRHFHGELPDPCSIRFQSFEVPMFHSSTKHLMIPREGSSCQMATDYVIPQITKRTNLPFATLQTSSVIHLIRLPKVSSSLYNASRATSWNKRLVLASLASPVCSTWAEDDFEDFSNV
jgi:hypothetical protein